MAFAAADVKIGAGRRRYEKFQLLPGLDEKADAATLSRRPVPKGSLGGIYKDRAIEFMNLTTGVVDRQRDGSGGLYPHEVGREPEIFHGERDLRRSVASCDTEAEEQRSDCNQAVQKGRSVRPPVLV